MSEQRCVLCGRDPAPGFQAVTGRYSENILVNARLCNAQDEGHPTCYEQVTQGMIKHFSIAKDKG